MVKQRRQTGRSASADAAVVLREGLSAYPVCVLTDLPAILGRAVAYSYWRSSLAPSYGYKVIKLRATSYQLRVAR